MDQLRRSSEQRIFPSATPMTISTLPVKSSAPAAITRTRPIENAMPPRSRVGPPAERAVGGDDRVGECPEADIGTREDRQHQCRERRLSDFRQAGELDPLGDLRRPIGVEFDPARRLASMHYCDVSLRWLIECARLQVASSGHEHGRAGQRAGAQPLKRFVRRGERKGLGMRPHRHVRAPAPGTRWRPSRVRLATERTTLSPQSSA